MTKVNLKNSNEVKSDIFPWSIFKSDTISFFNWEEIKVFQSISKSKFLCFMTTLNRNNGNETRRIQT